VPGLSMSRTRGDAATEKVLFEQLTKLQTDLVPDAELRNAKNQMRAGLYRRLTPQGSLNSQFGKTCQIRAICHAALEWEHGAQLSGTLHR
jgi:hypothetical protein